jgi:hypothetical protein
VKYDLYELAKRYPLANPNDLYVIQTELDSKQLTKEQVEWIKRDIQTGVNTSSDVNNQNIANPSLSVTPIENALRGEGFYFDNDIPKGSVTSFKDYYTAYKSQESTYIKEAPTQTTPYTSDPSVVKTFFTEVIKNNYSEISKQLDKIYENAKQIKSINKNTKLSKYFENYKIKNFIIQNNQNEDKNAITMAINLINVT